MLTGLAAQAGYPLPDDEMLRQIPLEVALSFAGGAVPPTAIAQLVAAANA